MDPDSREEAKEELREARAEEKQVKDEYRTVSAHTSSARGSNASA